MQRGRRSWFRFSTRSLMALLVLVAVYLGGRESRRLSAPVAPKLAGTWQMTMPAGFKRAVAIKQLAPDRVLLSNGGVLSGVYRWQDDSLVVVEPSDARMVGLTWRWDGKELLLIAEPKGKPTGSSYVGATMTQPRP